MSSASQSIRACPALGLMDDPGTSLNFPSVWNYCHRSQPISPARFKHQEQFCLGGKYKKCPLFLSEQAMQMPQELQIPRRPLDSPKNNPRGKRVIAMTVFIAVLGVGWGMVRQGLLPVSVREATSSASPSAESVVTVTRPPSDAFSFVSTMTGIPTTTHMPSATITPGATPTSTPAKHQLEALIGTEYIFVIHTVLPGEELSQLAAKYDTSVEAIKIVNYFQRNPGWSGTQVVIPVGFTDVARLPSLVIYQVKSADRGISIEDLAEYLRVSPLDLKYYNGWTSAGDRPLVGDWLLVPRSRPMP